MLAVKRHFTLLYEMKLQNIYMSSSYFSFREGYNKFVWKNCPVRRPGAARLPRRDGRAVYANCHSFSIDMNNWTYI